MIDEPFSRFRTDNNLLNFFKLKCFSEFNDLMRAYVF